MHCLIHGFYGSSVGCCFFSIAITSAFIKNINIITGTELERLFAGLALGVLLSNLLNNAIEACEKCEADRIIKIKCIYEENEFVLSIKNTYDESVYHQPYFE